MNTTTAKQTRKRLGLTPAMRRALSGYKCSYAVVQRAAAVGLVDTTASAAWITPRGRAALAAEPMTDAQYTALALIAEHGDAVVTHSVVNRTLVRRGWIYAYSIITTAGRTQLHNVRAAMPGDWSPR